MALYSASTAQPKRPAISRSLLGVCVVVIAFVGWTQFRKWRKELDESLVAAVQSGNIKDIEALIARGADPNTIHDTSERQTGLIGYLRELRAEKNPSNSVVALAMRAQKWDIALRLLNSGAVFSKHDMIDPLCGASRDGAYAFVEHLIQHGVQINGTDIAKNTPLTSAVIGGHTDIVTLLLANGADIKQVAADKTVGSANGCKLGALPFFLFTSDDKDRKESVLRCLLEHGLDINHEFSSDRRTLLCLAAIFNDIPLFSFLIERGADPGIRDLRNKTALDYGKEDTRAETRKVIDRVRSSGNAD